MLTRWIEERSSALEQVRLILEAGEEVPLAIPSESSRYQQSLIAAEGAVHGVMRKLQVCEDSVSSTVDDLIEQATSEKRLALMYEGWAPWV